MYFTQYRNWATAALDTIRGTLRAAGLQGSQLSSEQAVLSTLRSQAAQPNGAVRAIQVMTDIAEQQTQQLMKLRQIMLADLSSKQAYQAALLSRKRLQRPRQSSSSQPRLLQAMAGHSGREPIKW